MATLAVLLSVLAGAPDMSSEPVQLNVFAWVDAPSEQRVRQLGGRLGGGGEPSLVMDHVVHCTLYMSWFDPARKREVEAAVKALVAKQRGLPLRLRGLARTPGGWVFLEAERTLPLQALHGAVVEAVSPLRKTPVPVPSWVTGMPPGPVREKHLDRLGQTGSPSAGDLFAPHFTLFAAQPPARLDGMFANEKPKTLLTGMAHARVRGLGVGLADATGQMREADVVRFTFPR